MKSAVLSTPSVLWFGWCGWAGVFVGGMAVELHRYLISTTASADLETWLKIT
jgi:hypothetical protein